MVQEVEGLFLEEEWQWRGCMKKHGMSETPEFWIWCGAMGRCYGNEHRSNPTARRRYRLYQGRGIYVCDRWRDKERGFLNFYEDMGPRPSPKHSLDRIDNDGPYSPENCQWATQREQMRNTRVNRLLTFEGETKPMAVWADEMDIPLSVLSSRLNGYRWSVENALTTPVNDHTMLTVNGVTKTHKEWAEEIGISAGTLKARLHRGRSPEEAVERPFGYRDPSPKVSEDYGRITLATLARKHGIRSGTLHARLRRGMTMEEALASPVAPCTGHPPIGKPKPNVYLEHNGVRMTMAEWAKRDDTPNYNTLINRVRRGWSTERALFGRVQKKRPRRKR